MSEEATSSPKPPEGLHYNPEDYTLEEILKPSRSALLIIDMQNDFLSTKGFFATRKEVPGTVDQMQSTVPHIQKLIEAARKSGALVIFTKGYEDVKFRRGPDIRRAVKWYEKDGDGSINSESGTWGSELYEGIEPQDGDVVLEKHKWSAFDGKDKDGRSLKQILDESGRQTLVVTGVVAETCVETSIRDAYDNNYFVVVPKNSVGSNQQDQLEARMGYWEAGFVSDVVDEGEIEEVWSNAPKDQ